MSRAQAHPHRQPSDSDSLATSDSQSDRLEELEVAVAVMQKTLDIQFARMAQMQAQIDRLTAKDRYHEEPTQVERPTPTI